MSDYLAALIARCASRLFKITPLPEIRILVSLLMRMMRMMRIFVLFSVPSVPPIHPHIEIYVIVDIDIMMCVVDRR